MAALQPLDCQHEGVALRGQMAVPDGAGPFRTVLVMHSALGLYHMACHVATKLAGLGYLAVATDMYGVDADLSAPEKAGQHYMALLEQPALTLAILRGVAARLREVTESARH